MTARGIAALVGFEALTLAVASTLHFSHVLHGESKPFSGTHAGISEAAIGVVLAFACVQLVRRGVAARFVALGAVAFAILGFLIGLNFSVRGGTPADLAYHASMLPVLLATAFAVWRSAKE